MYTIILRFFFYQIGAMHCTLVERFLPPFNVS